MKKDRVKDVLGSKKLSIARAQASVFICDTYFAGYSDGATVGLSIGPIFVYLEGKDGNQIWFEDNSRAVSFRFYELYKKGGHKKLLKKNLEIFSQLEKMWPGDDAMNKCSLGELQSFWEKFLPVFDESAKIDAIAEDKGSIVNEFIVPEIARIRKWPFEKAEKVVIGLTHPDRLTVFNQEKELFLGICEEISEKKIESLDEARKNKKVMRGINSYLRDFFWFESNFYDFISIDEKKLFKRAKEYTEKNSLGDIKKEITKLKQEFLKIKKKERQLVSRLKLSKKEKEYIDFVKFFITWIDDRKMSMMKKVHYANSFNFAFGKVFGLSQERSAGLTRKEIGRLLKGGKIDLKKIDERNKEVFMFFNNGKLVNIYTGKDAQYFWRLCKKMNIKEKDAKGMVASRSKARKVVGQVKIVLDPFKTNFRQDEILLTSMTRVEYVPLMHKAKAIITNEGGIACHAAIVSRELKIPCIVGVKTATEIFKSGDMVEMDMDKGTVKKIK